MPSKGTQEKQTTPAISGEIKKKAHKKYPIFSIHVKKVFHEQSDLKLSGGAETVLEDILNHVLDKLVLGGLKMRNARGIDTKTLTDEDVTTWLAVKYGSEFVESYCQKRN